MGRFTELIDDSLQSDALQRPVLDPFSDARMRAAQPDAAAAAQRIAAETGLDPAVAARNIDEIQQREEAARFRAFLNDVPQAQRLGDDFNTTAKDDVPTLSAIALNMLSLKQQATEIGARALRTMGVGSLRLATNTATGFGSFLWDLVPGEYADAQAQYGRDLQRELDEILDSWSAAADPDAGFVEQAIYAGVESMGANIPPLLAAARTGNVSLALGPLAGMVGGQSYHQARNAGRDVLGSAVYAGGQASVETLFGRLPVERLLGDLATNAPFWQLLARQLATEIPTEQATTLAQDLNEWVAINPEKTVEDFIAERGPAAVQTLIATIVGTVGQTTIMAGAQKLAQREVEQADARTQLLTELGTLAEASKLRERAPEQFRRYVDSLTPDTDLYVDAADMAQVLEQSEFELPDELEARIAEAAEAETPVRISPAEYATYFADAHTAQFLTSRVRVGAADALNAEEAKNIESEFAARAERAVADAENSEISAQGAEIRAQVQAQIQSTGRFRADVATAYASLIENFFVTMAGRTGMSPGELFARYPLRVQADLTQAPAEEQLEQLAPDAFKVMPDALRDGQTIIHAGDFGRMELDAVADDVLQIKLTHVNADQRGQGIGQQLIMRAYDEAQEQGRRLISDRAVSALQLRAYEALRRRGWNIVYWDAAEVARVLDLADRAQRAGKPISGLGASAPLGDAVVRVIAPPREAALNQAALRPVAALAAEAGDVPQGFTRLRHFGNLNVPELDPRFMGTGMRGEERRRAGPRVISLYPDTGFQKESGVGPVEYVVDVPTSQLYDANADPLNLQAEAQEPVSYMLDDVGRLVPAETRLDMDVYEQAIKDAGFAGYVTPGAEGNLRGQARLFESVPVVGAPSQPGVARQAAEQETLEQAGRLQGLPSSSPGPIPTIAAAARQYMELSGIENGIPEQTAYVRANPERGARIAQAYENAKHDPANPDVQAAYAALIAETLAQYQVIKAMGLNIEFIPPGAANPYAGGPREVLADLARGHLWVFPTDQGFGQEEAPGHPLLLPTDEFIGDRQLLANDVFRIVHDVFGHGIEGVGFGPNGEENAFQSHVRMYSPLAARAMTTETRGQNSWVNFGPFGEQNRANQRDTRYAEQKATLLPEWVTMEAVGEETVEQSARGRITMGRDLQATPSIVTLFENADLSTFLHESGHFFFEIMADMAARPTAPQQIQEDMQRLLDWVGFKGTLQEWRAQTLGERRTAHEQFARGFEAFLMEGDAPSEALRPLFHRFRAWLVNIYRQLTQLNVQLTPEVREVMARMLADSEQIRAAEEARSYAPLFPTADKSGMSPEEWLRYQELTAAATQQAEDQLQARSLRNLRWLDNARSRELKKLQDANAAKRAEVEAEVEADMDKLPVRLAERIILDGRAWLPGLVDEEPQEVVIGGPHKLSTASLAETYGTREEHKAMAEAAGLDPAAVRAPWQALPRKYTAREGLTADEVAEIVGLQSGDQLVNQLLGLEDRSQAVQRETDRRMLERYGDLNNPQLISRAVDNAVHNQFRMRAITAELAALDAALKAQPGGIEATRRAAREFAARVVQQKKIRDIRPGQFTAAETKAARESQQALAAGDTRLAATRKRDQLFNGYASRNASRALDYVEKNLRYLQGFNNTATRKALDPSYRDQIDKLLERFDLRRRSLREIDKRTALASWIEEQRANGTEPVIPDELLDESRRTNYKNLSFEDFQGLVDSIKNIEHLARLKKKLLASAEQRDFDAAANTIAASVEENASGKQKDELEKATSLWGRIANTTHEWLTHLRKFSSVARQMDGGKDGGAVWSYFSRALNAASDKEVAMRAEATRNMTALIKKVPSLQSSFLRRIGQRVAGAPKLFIPEINRSLSLEARIAVALNWGNAGNRERIMEGNRWTEAQAQAVINTLSKQEMDFVQATWDMIGSYWPQIAAKEERVNGVRPTRVDPTPVNTPHGQYAGGYYPIVADGMRSERAAQQNDAELIGQALRGAVTRATTRRGHTKARVGGKDPVRLDLGVISQHLSQVIHDLSWHETLIDTGRLLRDKRVSDAIRGVYGSEVTKLMRRTLDDVARGDVHAKDAGERLVNHFRVGATISALGLNLTTSMLQLTGVTQSFVRVGYRHMAAGLVEYMASPRASYRRVHEASEFMRGRHQLLNRELGEITNRLGQRQGLTTAALFAPIMALQTAVDIPTWLAGYNKAVAAGEEHDRAVALADQGVRDAQSTGALHDLAEVQRGGAYKKLLTNFYSYFSATYQLSAETIGNVKREKTAGSVVKVAADFIMLFTVPAALGLLIREGLRGDLDDDDPEELAEALIREQLSFMLGVFPYVREVGGALAGFEYRGPAGLSFLSHVTTLIKQIEQGEADEALLRAANRAAGAAFHYPAGQIDKTVRGMIAVAEGEAGPGALIVGPPQE